MPWGLRRFQSARDLHFITFSCYRRARLLTPLLRDRFEWALEQARRHYGFYVVAYVVMPEHVHLLLSETEQATLATAIQAMKQSVARRVGGRFWQERYYDFNVWTRTKREEKMHYIHMNPVRRELVKRPEDWKWSSFLPITTGAPSVVEVESQWTARARERLGIVPRLRIGVTTPPKPKPGLDGAPSGARKHEKL